MSVQKASIIKMNQSKLDNGAVPGAKYLPSPFSPRLILRHSGVRLGEPVGSKDLTVDKQDTHSMKESGWQRRLWMLRLGCGCTLSFNEYQGIDCCCKD